MWWDHTNTHTDSTLGETHTSQNTQKDTHIHTHIDASFTQRHTGHTHEAEAQGHMGHTCRFSCRPAVPGLAPRGTQAAKLLGSSEMTSSTEFDELVQAVSAILSKSTSVPLVERAENPSQLPPHLQRRRREAYMGFRLCAGTPSPTRLRRWAPPLWTGELSCRICRRFCGSLTTRKGALLAVAVMVLAFSS